MGKPPTSSESSYQNQTISSLMRRPGSHRYLAIEHILGIKREVVPGDAGPVLSDAAPALLSRLIVALAAHPANVHVHLLADGQLLGQVGSPSLLRRLPRLRLQLPGRVRRLNVLPLLKLEARAIQLEHGHDGGTGEDALFEIAVLLAIEILGALVLHVIRHVLRQMRQVCLQLAWITLHYILDQERQEGFLFIACRCLYHFFCPSHTLSNRLLLIL